MSGESIRNTEQTAIKGNVRILFLLPLGLGLVVLLVTCLYTLRELQNHYIEEQAEAQVSNTDTLFQAELEKDSQILLGLTDFLKADKNLRKAWSAGDRQALLDQARPVFEDIRQKYRVTHFYFHGTDRVCFLRVHEPQRYGDYIDRFTMDRAAGSGEVSWGIELGPLGTFTLRVVCPWLIDGKLAGYIELGEEIEHIAPHMKEMLRSELVFIVDKDYLKSAGWKAGMKMLGRNADWDQFPHFVVIGGTINDMPPKLRRYLRKLDDCTTQEHLSSSIKFSLNQRIYCSRSLPLIDAGGRDVGDIIILTDVTMHKASLTKLSLLVTAVCGFVGLILFALLLRHRGRIEQRLKTAYDGLTDEIAGHKKTEGKLKEQNDFLNSVLASLTHPFYVIDANDYTIKIANPAMKLPKLTEKTTCYTVTHKRSTPCEGTEHCCPLKEIKQTKQPVMVEHIHYNENGEPRYVEVHAYPIFDSQGNVSQIIEHTIDISERRMAQDRILREKRFSENLIDSSVDGIFAYDTDCRCTLWNPAMERISGISKEEILGKCIFDIIGFLKETGEDKPLREALSGRAVVARDRPYTIPQTQKQGFFEGYYGPLHDTEGQIMGGLAIVRDITTTRRAEEEVRKSKLLYQNLVETSHDLIFQCNREGEYVFLNKAWEKTFGYRIDEMLGRSFSDFKTPETAKRDMQVFARLLEGESIVGYETTYITKSGKERYLLFNEVPRYDTSGQIIGTQGTAFDITEHKLTEQMLQNLNKELETAVERLTAANSELADFAHITAHDLKTPLRGIGSLAGIISAEYRDYIDDHGRQLLDMLVGRANRMYEQIDGILAYSEIGRLDEKKGKIDLNELVKEVINTINPPSYIKISIESDLPALVCNKVRMAQVFQNLLDNAIKYIDKPEGRIFVGCVQEEGFWKFNVTDNGCGIEEKYYEKIFQMFQTLSRRDGTDGTGIGLSIVKKIVEKYDGKVWVESQTGKETTFFFTLPMRETGVQNAELKADTTG